MRQVHDGEAVDGGYAVSHLHLTYAVCGAALDDTTNFVRYDWDGEMATCYFSCIVKTSKEKDAKKV